MWRSSHFSRLDSQNYFCNAVGFAAAAASASAAQTVFQHFRLNNIPWKAKNLFVAYAMKRYVEG